MLINKKKEIIKEVNISSYEIRAGLQTTDNAGLKERQDDNKQGLL